MKFVSVLVGLALLGSVFSQSGQSYTSALDRMVNITSLDDFMALLRTNRGRQITDQDIYSKHRSFSGRKVVASGGYMAEPDQCSLREVTVDLGLSDEDPNVVYFPTCTKIMRCGGCCASRNVPCVPAQTKNITLNVLKAEVPYHGSDHFIFSGVQKVFVERHLSCRLQCDLSKEKCGHRKRFLPQKCACTCAENRRCYGPTRWDPETCMCVCKKSQECSRGRVFNRRNCRCEVDFGRHEASGRTGSMTNSDNRPRPHKQSADHGRRPHHQSADHGRRPYQQSADHGRIDYGRNKPTAATTTTTTTTITTTAAAAAAAASRQDRDCALLPCPSKYRGVRKSGVCVCRRIRRGWFNRYRFRYSRNLKNPRKTPRPTAKPMDPKARRGS